MILSLSIFSKDASATAIYGSRASNGVIIITTKKGRSGKMRFNFSTQYSLSTLPKEADVLTPAQFRAYVNSMALCTDCPDGNASTDWQNEIYNNASILIISKHVRLCKDLPYRVSIGFLSQDGILRTGNLERNLLRSH